MSHSEKTLLGNELRKVEKELSIVNEKLVHLEKEAANAAKEVAYVKKEAKYLGEKAELLKKFIEVKKTIPQFNRFLIARVRMDKTSNTQTSVPDFWRSYRYWVEATTPEGVRLTQVKFINELENHFGKPVRPLYQDTMVYNGVRVFNSAEEVEQYDEDICVKYDEDIIVSQAVTRAPDA